VDDGDVQQRVDIEVRDVVHEVRGETQQQVVRLTLHLGDTGVRAVGLVDEEDDGKLRLERLAQDETRLRQRALARVDEQHHAVHHRESALDLAAEVRVAGSVDHVDGDRSLGVRAVVGDRRVLGEDRDALLALQVVRVHGALLDVRVLAERSGLTEHRVHQRGLAVIDVGDDCDVAEVCAEGVRHAGVLRMRVGCAGIPTFQDNAPERGLSPWRSGSA
ncbi:hypothetical protein ABE10_12385, partial [Bacillus toyonensis]|nr:hypothetical protein [Bacillus toyonensis]